MKDEARRPFWKNPFLIGFVAGAIVLTVLPFLQHTQLRAPPPIAPLGEWQLVDENGRPFGSHDLQGQVWIASFFFARCPSLCPAQQASLVKALPHFDDLVGKPGVAPIRLVSFTVDPDNDTPDVLLAYERKLLERGSDRWTLLTGPRADLENLIAKRFLVAMGERAPVDGASDLYDIPHASKFALVDQRGDLRGFWSTDDEGRGNIINAARLLAKEGPTP